MISIVAMGLLLLLVCLGAVGYFMSGLVIRIRTYADDDIFRFETESGTIIRERIEELVKEEVSIESPFGYRLRGWFIPAERDEGKAVILAHGVTSTLIGSLKYMEMFRRRGFHVLAYDHRRHGASGGRSTTYGLYEKHDLKACMDWLYARCGPSCRVGVFGESMGAATALQHAAIDRRAAFYVVDCPYADLTEELAYRLREDFRLPPFPFLQAAGLFSWLRSGLRFGRVSPLRDIAGVETPILFIHGDSDRYIPKEMTLQLYDAKPGFKRLSLMPGADHAQSLRADPAAYDRTVGAFLAELGLADADTPADTPADTQTEPSAEADAHEPSLQIMSPATS